MKLLAIAVILLATGCTGNDSPKASFELRPVTEVGQAPCAQGTTPSTDGTECYRLSQGMSRIRPDKVQAGETNGTWVVQVTLNKADATTFAELTTRLNQQAEPLNRLAVVIDGKVLTAPTIASPIPGGTLEISGEFTQKTATELAERLRDG